VVGGAFERFRSDSEKRREKRLALQRFNENLFNASRAPRDARSVAFAPFSLSFDGAREFSSAERQTAVPCPEEKRDEWLFNSRSGKGRKGEKRVEIGAENVRSDDGFPASRVRDTIGGTESSAVSNRLRR